MTEHTCDASGKQLQKITIDVSDMSSLLYDGSKLDIYVCVEPECVVENHTYIFDSIESEDEKN